MASYGFQLPAGFKKAAEAVQSDDTAESDPSYAERPPQSAKTTYGPTLPPELLKRTNPVDTYLSESSVSDAVSDVSRSVIGPVIPSSLSQRKDTDATEPPVATPSVKRVMGPQLPPGLQRSAGEDISQAPFSTQPDEDEDDMVGPSLSLMANERDFSAAVEVSRRMARAAEKARKAQEPVIQERESWMTELPEALLGRSSAALLPTGPRSFKRRTDEYEADFSGWTSGPDKKNKPQPKEKDSIELVQYQQSLERERELEQQVAGYNKEKRSDALATIVQKTRKPENPTERRPFDRERDLNIQKVVKLDEKEITKRADALKSRFSSSATAGQKFL